LRFVFKMRVALVLLAFSATYGDVVGEVDDTAGPVDDKSPNEAAYEPTERVKHCVDVELETASEADKEYCKDALREAKNNMEVHRLLEKGHDPDRPLDWQGRTKIILSTFRGEKDIVAELINFGQANVNAKAKTGHTALMYAAGEGHTDLIQLFLAAGSDVNAAVEGLAEGDERPSDYDASRAMLGYTALHFACMNSRLRATAMLLDAGADMQSKEHGGKTALEIALEAKSKHVRNKFKLLFENVEKLRAEDAAKAKTEL